MRSLLVAVVFASACRKHEPPPPPLLARYPIRPHVQWTEHRDRFGTKTTQRREERWTAIGEGTWDVVTSDVETGKPFYRARYSLLKDGLAQTGVFEGAAFVSVTPPRIALPLDTTVGNQWERTHTVGKHTSTRRCELVAAEGCRDGIEQRCTTTYEDGRIVDVHNRYCGGIGMVGYSSTTKKLGSDEVVRIWSEDLIDVREDAR